MDSTLASNTLVQLASYTRDCCEYHKIDYEQGGKNSYGAFKQDCPYGAITHFTASNEAVSKKRPFGRDPVLRNRFARGSAQRVGVQFITMDRLQDRYRHIREKYELLEHMPAEVMYFGDDLAFWHAGWVNKWCYGIEVRNLGRLSKSNGVFQWSAGKYNGRPPIQIDGSYWEPYTRSQVEATLWVHRLMSAIYPIRPEWFLGHYAVSSTRTDPGKHFPIHEMRHYSLVEPDVPFSEIKFLDEFSDYDTVDDETVDVSEASEAAIHAGLYRHDWDGRPDDMDYELAREAAEGFDPGDVSEAKKAFRVLGYWPGDDNTDDVTEEYKDTVKAFRGRWKVRQGRRWVQEIPLHGGMDKVAQKKLKQMLRWWEAL